MTSTFETLLQQAVKWADNAGIGDGGERPSFEIERSDSEWDINAYSFYDGGGSYRGPDLDKGMAAVLLDIKAEPEKEKKRELESAAFALARWKRISKAEAKALLEAMA